MKQNTSNFSTMNDEARDEDKKKKKSHHLKTPLTKTSCEPEVRKWWDSYYIYNLLVGLITIPHQIFFFLV